ncbi:apolipoprotein N-acyltransferase [Chloroherpeton thalassium]|uniref:apolipoprotein N-acyltransferase n=1 Tax=Chloroherpeton thalassium TaxID=100716 RepID=UPI0012F9953A|nr:apolipoprotein N-acyltransferase [Chloroherpeton thalassium]
MQLEKSIYKKIGLAPAILSGLLLGISFPSYPGIHLELLAWFGLVPLLLQLKELHSFREAFRQAYISMFLFVLASVWWISLSTVFGAVLTYFAQTFFMTVPVLVFFFLKERLGWKTALWALPFIWTAWEWLYLDMDISFGWLTLGNSQANLFWLVQYVDLFGTWAISFWLILFNVLLVMALEKWESDWKSAGFLKDAAKIGGAMLLLPLVYSAAIFLQADENSAERKVRVSIIQPNIDPFAKWETMTRHEILTRHLEMSDSVVAEQKPDMLVWPETTIPYFILLPNATRYREKLFSAVKKWSTPVLTGFSDAVFYADSTLRKPGAKYDRRKKQYYDTFNSAMLVRPDTNWPEVFHKIQLVPFAERVPYMEYVPFLSFATVELAGISSWGQGDEMKVFSFQTSAGDSVRVSCLICYESIYPGFTAEYAARGAEFLTVITNDGWFSKSYGPYQHAAFARLRSIETRRAMARCANTGISFFIDKYGRTYGEIPWWEALSTTEPLALSSEKSFYVRHIDLFPKLCSAMTILILTAAIGLPYWNRLGKK